MHETRYTPAARLHLWRSAVWLFPVLTACSDLSGTTPLPAGISDPKDVRTVAAARALYETAVDKFVYTTDRSNPANVAINYGAFLSAVMEGGVLADELQVANLGGPSVLYQLNQVVGHFTLDARRLPELTQDPAGGGSRAAQTDYVQVYQRLQTVRARASQAIGALRLLDSASAPLQAHLYALTGYAEILLADLFCSGVPLSTFDFDQDYTLRPGSPTRAIYAHADSLFDRAIALATAPDTFSVQILNLARVGKGRALLNQGLYALAAAAVQEVPHDFRYAFPVDWAAGTHRKSVFNDVWWDNGNELGSWSSTVPNREGGNGRAFREGDPRTATVVLTVENYLGVGPDTSRFGDSVYFPAKYGTSLGVAPITVADWTEAQLILAEAALHKSGGVSAMLGILNQLRAEVGMSPTAIDPAASNPQRAAVDTLFAERAAWLFLTGHRQGDLRRRIREYHDRRQDEVYPAGPYPSRFVTFGNDVNLPVPAQELGNPNFNGCIDRGA